MAKVFGLTSTFVAALALSAACTVNNTEPPGLTGPSALAQSISITALPDRITQNGRDQSSITVGVVGPNGAPVNGVALRVDMLVEGTLVDFGTLSARSLVTGSDGRASAVYTAPPAPPPSANSGSNTVTIRAIALGTNAQASLPFTTDIRLVPPGVILPPADTPTAQFTFSPTPVNQNVAVTFDASASCAGAISNGVCTSGSAITSYAWTFGDGATGTGKTVSHAFTSAATFNVTLTVTNDRGVSASTTTAVTAIPSVGPTASFVFSPAGPVVGQAVVFNADASRAAAGHTITQYSWIFGDGASTTGFLVTHAFSAAGTYNVTLTVADELGQKSTTSSSVAVIVGGAGTLPAPSFTFSPAQPGIGEAVFFNGSASTGGSGHAITSYNWTFGDGVTGTGVTTSHVYTTAGTYSVQLQVTNDVGQSVTSSATAILVGNPPAPIANFTSSPTAPTGPVVGQLVVFDASSSTTAQGQTIVDVAWNFGDGTAVIHCPGDPSCITTNGTNRISAHTYTIAQSFIVNLVVTDSAGRIGSKSGTVIVLPGNPVPVVTFSPTTPTAGSIVSFNSGSSTTFGGATIATYAWDFGDPTSATNTSALANPTHTFAAGGRTYTVRLTITDSQGRSGTVTISVPVTP